MLERARVKAARWRELHEKRSGALQATGIASQGEVLDDLEDAEEGSYWAARGWAAVAKAWASIPS